MEPVEQRQKKKKEVEGLLSARFNTKKLGKKNWEKGNVKGAGGNYAFGNPKKKKKKTSAGWGRRGRLKNNRPMT